MRRLAAIISLAAMAGCNLPSSTEPYTLYRSSIVGALRVHVATFDASDGDEYNAINCQIAADLFQRQPGVTVTYWCEKGRYRP